MLLKAKKAINESDLVVFVLDSRFPDLSRNKYLEKYALERGKKIIFALSKADLVKKRGIASVEGVPAVYVSSRMHVGSSLLRELIKKHLPEGGKVSFVGFPNVGKSSLINLLVGKGAAGIGKKPGFTKGVQWIKLTKKILLLDSPGVFDTKNKLVLFLLGSLDVDSLDDAETELVSILKEKGIKEDVIEKIGKKKGFLLKGGGVDTERTARFLLKKLSELGMDGFLDFIKDFL